MKHNRFTLPLFLILTAIFLAFFIKTIIYLDPDFGWYIKTGEIIFTKGIPYTDPFSYTMASYHYADHEWLSNLLVYQIYHQLGRFGVAFIYCLVTVVSLFIIIPKELTKYSSIPILSSAILIFPFVGTRHQVIGWLFLAILLKIILNQKYWSKFKYSVPLLFLIWVNLHGSFLLGILILGLSQIIKPFTGFRTEVVNLGVLILSILSTLINPFGLNVWHEVLKSATDSSLRFTIMEWYPTILQPDLIEFMIVGFSLAFFFRFRTKFSLIEKLVFIVLSILALSSQRNIPIWAIFNVYLLTLSSNYFAEECSIDPLIKQRFNLFTNITFLAVLGLFLIQFLLNLLRFSTFADSKYYPEQAIYFIQNQHLKGQIFAPYDWGGYLIWKLPQYKEFIDGRMPSWKFKAPIGQTNDAFVDYLAIIQGKTNFSDMSSKYNIKTVLWKYPHPPADRLTQLRTILEFATIHLYQTPKPFDFNKSLEEKGWKKIYQDDIAVIYQSPS